MEEVYHLDQIISKLSILTYTKSVLQALENPGKYTNAILNTIIKLAETLKQAGTNKVYLYWIPSHMGIPGNERTDALASKERI